MSLRIKAALVIFSVIFVFTAASYFSNLSFTRENLTKTLEQDLTLALAIADDLISTRIRLLKADAETVAERLLRIPPGRDINAAMASQLALYPEFISLAVYDSGGIIAFQGEPVDYSFILNNGRYLETAFGGNSIISTTHYSGLTGALLMYVFVPMGENMVLSATFPGMTFADMVSRYRLWETGNIFIVDDSGTFIANYRANLVQERQNFIYDIPDSRGFNFISDVFQKMITTEEGADIYYYAGVKRLCVYKRLAGSNAGWRVAVAAPLHESPEAGMQTGLLLSSLLFLAVGAVVSFFVSAAAVIPLNRIEAQNKALAELNETVKAISAAKGKFLAQMSHEMRTPLNAVLGLSKLAIENDKLGDQDREKLEKIYNAGAILLSTVNDILDISKIDSGKFQLTPVEYDTPSMINDVVAQSIMRKGDKPVEFVLDIGENFPARLCGDDLRIKQILNNLLSNAFKFTEKGTVELVVKHEDGEYAGEKAVWLSISVRDTGAGISPENVSSLFVEYAQMDIKSNNRVEGTGLGLPVAKMMTELMGGSISVESEFGKGSVFTVSFPQKYVGDTVIGPEVVNNLKKNRYSASKRDMNLWLSHYSLPDARVLVVDDVEINLEVAKGILSCYGMQIDCVTGGQEAIDAVRNGKVRYNAIFMDHMMPGMDGIEATRIIRLEIGTEYARNVPIIALTANAIVGNEEMFLSKGFQAFLSKPVEIPRLDAVIKRWIRDRETENSC